MRIAHLTGVIATGLIAMSSLPASAQTSTTLPVFRPPAVPLVAVDPYFSVWSFDDKLTDGRPKHWTGSTMAMCSLARIDGKSFRVIGPVPEEAPAMVQTRLDVFPTRTIYGFEAAGVKLTLTFLTPSLPHDLDALGRPVTYVTWDAVSADGNPHDISLYLDLTGEWVVNQPAQSVNWSRLRAGDLDILRMGSQEQRVLGSAGDNRRIDWGNLFLAVPRQPGVETLLHGPSVRNEFVREGKLTPVDDLNMPRAADENWPLLACSFDLGKVDAKPATRWAILAYDDVFSIELLQRRLRPYWRRAGAGPADMLLDAARDRESLAKRCEAFDSELMADLTAAGGPEFAVLSALAYRQCLAAGKLAADFDGTPLVFSKENFSNGCISTVDVIYPASPFFLLLNPALLRAQLTPVLDYASSTRWKHPLRAARPWHLSPRQRPSLRRRRAQ